MADLAGRADSGGELCSLSRVLQLLPGARGQVGPAIGSGEELEESKTQPGLYVGHTASNEPSVS